MSKDLYKGEGIVQIISRTPDHYLPGDTGERYRERDEIWGLSNRGRVFQMTDHGWQLRLGELHD